MRFSELKNTYLFVRHGETDWNEEKRLMGQIDIPLNQTGREQLASIQLPVHIDRVFSSPLVRAQETAQILFPERPIDLDQRLIEKNGGLADGLLFDEIKTNFPAVWSLWEADDVERIFAESRFPQGESDQEVAERVAAFLFDLEQAHQQAVIALVSHSGIFRAIKYLLGASKNEIFSHGPGNGTIEALHVYSSDRQILPEPKDR